jgi:hypothetical protein
MRRIICLLMKESKRAREGTWERKGKEKHRKIYKINYLDTSPRCWFVDLLRLKSRTARPDDRFINSPLSVGRGAEITTVYGLGDRGIIVRVPVRSRIFSFSTSSRPALGPTQPPGQCAPGALFPGVKRPGRKADHSPPTSAEVKKMWIYTTTPPYAFMT